MSDDMVVIDMEEARKRLASRGRSNGVHWEKMDEGWYLSPNFGEIVLNYFEKNGQWWFLPTWDDKNCYGPYPNLKTAKKSVRNRNHRPPSTRVRLDDQSAGETVKALNPPKQGDYSDSWPGCGTGSGPRYYGKKEEEPEEKVFVVGDVHGDMKTLRALLVAAGAVHYDSSSQRLFPLLRTKLVQVGDLISGTKKSKDEDIEALKEAGELFDVLLVGNHEHPYFHEQAKGAIPQFNGFKHDGDVQDEIFRLSHKYLPSFEHEGVLISHAGLVRDYEAAYESAEHASREINTRWFEDSSDPLFTRIGPARAGTKATSQSGGLMWSDWSEPKSRAFSQVVGHTPGTKVRSRPFTKFNTSAFNIDVSSTGRTKRMSGVWIKKGGDLAIVSVPFTSSKEVEKDGD